MVIVGYCTKFDFFNLLVKTRSTIISCWLIWYFLKSLLFHLYRARPRPTGNFIECKVVNSISLTPAPLLKIKPLFAFFLPKNKKKKRIRPVSKVLASWVIQIIIYNYCTTNNLTESKMLF